MQTLALLQIFMAAFFCFAPELQAHGLDLQSNIQALSWEILIKSVGGTQQESCNISEDLFLLKFFYKKLLLRDLQELRII